MPRNEIVAEYGSLGGSSLLAVMGAIVSLWPPADGPAKWAWVIAFVAAGVLATIAALRFNRATRRQIERMLGRGNSICFFRIRPESITDLSRPFQLFMKTIHGPVYDMNYWISPRTSNDDGTDPAYGSLDQRKPLHSIIHHGERGWDRALTVGPYRIDFDARSGYWRQLLTIFVDGGKLRQTIIVKDRDGNTL